jgi:hypothetical protein
VKYNNNIINNLISFIDFFGVFCDEVKCHEFINYRITLHCERNDEK